MASKLFASAGGFVFKLLVAAASKTRQANGGGDVVVSWERIKTRFHRPTAKTVYGCNRWPKMVLARRTVEQMVRRKRVRHGARNAGIKRVLGAMEGDVARLFSMAEPVFGLQLDGATFAEGKTVCGRPPKWW